MIGRAWFENPPRFEVATTRHEEIIVTSKAHKKAHKVETAAEEKPKKPKAPPRVLGVAGGRVGDVLAGERGAFVVHVAPSFLR